MQLHRVSYVLSRFKSRLCSRRTTFAQFTRSYTRGNGRANALTRRVFQRVRAILFGQARFVSLEARRAFRK